MAESRGLKALENWAKRVTSGYNGVNVKDMSSSFRDGLAFCAIIHHYYPELIDFESLSKENILSNNTLAFGTAEKQLGIPALLDAEDMVKYSIPDRLSIITYLSQLHNCFENQNRLNKIKPAVKRISTEKPSGPLPKVPLGEQKNVSRTHELCQVCKHRVYILERLMVSGKLYHRTCFRCCKCGTLLKPGAYVESDAPGVYECAVCPRDERNEPEIKSVEDFRTVPQQPSPSAETSLETTKTVASISPISMPRVPELSSKLNSARNIFLKKNIGNGKSVETDDSMYMNGESSIDDSFSMHLDQALEDLADDDEAVKDEDIPEKDDKGTVSSDRKTSDVLSKRSVPQNAAVGSSPIKEPDSVHMPYQSVFSREMLRITPLSSSALQKTKPESDVRSFNSLYSIGRKTSLSNGATNLDIPIIRSTSYSNSTGLPRPSSVTNFQSKDSLSGLNLTRISKGNSDSNLSADSICGSSNNTLRRGSLDAAKEHKINETFTSQQSRRLSFQLEGKRNGELPSTSLRSSVQDDNGTGNLKMSNDSFRPKTSVRQLIQLREASILESKMSVSNHMSDVKSKHKYSESSSVNSHSTVDGLLKSKEIQDESNRIIQQSDAPAVAERILNGEVQKDRLISQQPESNAESIGLDVNVQEILESSSATSDENLQQLDVSSNEQELLPIKPARSKSSSLKASDTVKDLYPDDLNPFGDEEDMPSSEPVKLGSYPDTLNPFGDFEDDDDVVIKKSDDYDDSKNPFASDDDDDVQTSSLPTTKIATKPPVPPAPSFVAPKSLQQSSPSLSSADSPTGSLTGTHKKRRAPKPPHVKELFLNTSIDSDSSSLPSYPSLKLTPSPKILKNKRAPPPPSPSMPPKRQESSSSLNDNVASGKQLKEANNMKVKSSESLIRSPKILTNGTDESESNQWKKKKRPAPPVPIPSRREIKKIPIKDIQAEMNDIEEKQMELEKQGRDLEVMIRDRDKDEEPTVEEEECIMQLFELVNQKNALFRRQAELMYIKRSQRLEEEQVELEYQIRCLMQKPASQKGEEDKAHEEQLVQRLLDVVDQRNEIVDSIEMDRKREAEEDVCVQEQMEIKNGDLTIPAELKEKQSKTATKKREKEKKHEKKKKKKSKEEEAKHETEDNEKRGTLHRKKWFQKPQP